MESNVQNWHYLFAVLKQAKGKSEAAEARETNSTGKGALLALAFLVGSHERLTPAGLFLGTGEINAG